MTKPHSTIATPVAFLTLLAILCFSCGSNTDKSDQSDKSTQTATAKPDSIPIGEEIEGDFDGDGQKETAMIVQTADKDYNKEGSTKQFAVKFSKASLPSFPIGCCEPQLFYEGDFMRDKKDKFSVYLAPADFIKDHNYTFTTYGLNGKSFRPVLPVSNIRMVGRLIPESSLEDIISVDEAGKVWVRRHNSEDMGMADSWIIEEYVIPE